MSWLSNFVRPKLQALVRRSELPDNLWDKCGQCGQPFDTFQTGAVCPRCRAQFAQTKCIDCGASHSMSEWMDSRLMPSKV